MMIHNLIQNLCWFLDNLTLKMSTVVAREGWTAEYESHDDTYIYIKMGWKDRFENYKIRIGTLIDNNLSFEQKYAELDEI